jgi:hypothetical protein
MVGREHRRHNRKIFGQIAALDVGDGSASTACEIIDISEGGARLRPMMCAPESMPDSFNLWISKSGKVLRRCNVAWRSDTEVGVKFFKG